MQTDLNGNSGVLTTEEGVATAICTALVDRDGPTAGFFGSHGRQPLVVQPLPRLYYGVGGSGRDFMQLPTIGNSSTTSFPGTLYRLTAFFVWLTRSEITLYPVVLVSDANPLRHHHSRPAMQPVRLIIRQ